LRHQLRHLAETGGGLLEPSLRLVGKPQIALDIDGIGCRGGCLGEQLDRPAAASVLAGAQTGAMRLVGFRQSFRGRRRRGCGIGLAGKCGRNGRLLAL
jgi:hypothetical protein